MTPRPGRRLPLPRNQIAEVVSIPAPVGGLNARDSVADMPPTDALLLDNLFPSPTSVGVRGGSTTWATGLPGPVNTLACFSSAGGTRKLFAASGTGIYDVTASGAVGSAAVSGLTSSFWQFVNFGAAGAQYLVMVNGSDSMEIYSSGGGWQTVTGVSAPIALTGVTTANLIHVNEFMGRLFFIEKNTMHAWYLPIGSVGGAAVQLDFSSQTRLGGYLMAMATWSVETQAGLTQMACFITSEGEVIVYQGNDPTYASSWYFVGNFRVGRPVGRRCFVKVGSDILMLSADGLFPLSKAMLTDRSQRQDAVSDKIQNLINNDVQSYSGNTGWQAILHPIGNKLIVNVPAGTMIYQYVMNTIHGAWCRFTGWSANCWELMGDALYFGASGNVYQADTGGDDSGGAISVVAIQAPNYFESHQQKQFTMARPIIKANAPMSISFQVNADFDTTAPTNYSSEATGGFTYWGAAWGSAWSTPSVIYKQWYTTTAVGFAGSPAMAFSVKDVTVTWSATDVAFIPGGVF